MNLALTYAAAQRANAAYEMNPVASVAGFAALGLTHLGLYQNDSHQAVVSHDAAGQFFLSISGTRFLKEWGDLFDDLDTTAVPVGDPALGAKVAAGAYGGLVDVYAWAKSLAPAGTIWTVEGHSLGGGRARFAPLFLSPAELGAMYSFESPKFANAAFWSEYAWEMDKLTSVVNGRDLWVSWPFISEYSHPLRTQVWLQDSGYQLITPDQWPGGRWPSDHDMGLVLSRLAALLPA